MLKKWKFLLPSSWNNLLVTIFFMHDSLACTNKDGNSLGKESNMEAASLVTSIVGNTSINWS